LASRLSAGAERKPETQEQKKEGVRAQREKESPRIRMSGRHFDRRNTRFRCESLSYAMGGWKHVMGVVYVSLGLRLPVVAPGISCVVLTDEDVEIVPSGADAK